MIIVGIVLSLITIFMVWLGINIQPVNPADEAETRVEIRSGASIEEVAALLNSKNLIRNSLAFTLYARLSFSGVQAGAHLISPSMSTVEIVRLLGSAEGHSYNVTILPELTIPEIKQSLINYGFSETEVDVALNRVYDHPLLATKPADHDLEGYIFPDTYKLHTSDSVEVLFNKAFDNLYQKLRADNSLAYMATAGLNIHETLTLASIVAREAPGNDDRGLVAGVFWNRLDNNIALGSDVTYKYAYAMGYCSSDTPSCQSAYNTRIHRGLPPGPIANMTYSAIVAVLHPTDSDYFYFVAGDDGQIHYSYTEAEHQRKAAIYCTVLCR
jgi:UPF0755 protein